MMDSKRLKELAGIREADDLELSPEEIAHEEQTAREALVEAMVREALAKLGIPATMVTYTENQNEVEAYMSDREYELEDVAGVLTSGMGTRYRLEAVARGGFYLRFLWNPQS